MTNPTQPGDFAKGRTPVCPHCGSESISMNAEAVWIDGAWQAETVHPDGSCGECESNFKHPHWKD